MYYTYIYITFWKSDAFQPTPGQSAVKMITDLDSNLEAKVIHFEFGLIDSSFEECCLPIWFYRPTQDERDRQGIYRISIHH